MGLLPLSLESAAGQRGALGTHGLVSANHTGDAGERGRGDFCLCRGRKAEAARGQPIRGALGLFCSLPRCLLAEKSLGLPLSAPQAVPPVSPCPCLGGDVPAPQVPVAWGKSRVQISAWVAVLGGESCCQVGRTQRILQGELGLCWPHQLCPIPGVAGDLCQDFGGGRDAAMSPGSQEWQRLEAPQGFCLEKRSREGLPRALLN